MATEETSYVTGWGQCARCGSRRPVKSLKEEIEKKDNAPDVKVTVCNDGWCEKVKANGTESGTAR